MQQSGFKIGKSNLELILSGDKFFFLLFKIWLLDLYDLCQKLIFKTSLSDDEVNDCALGCSFWFVMWVTQLSLEIKLEGGAHVNIFRSEFDCKLLSFLDKLS
jgi:hypothetical protein